MLQNIDKKIDVSKIYNGEVSEIPFKFEIVPENTDSMDLMFAAMPEVTGRVYEKAHGKGKIESYIMLEFSVNGKYATHCARCAKDLEKSFSIKKEYAIVKKLENDSENESDEFAEAPNGILDVSELAETAFYLELPSRVLCKENCKGLCAICGKDLNEGDCGCKIDVGANTLSDLKKLLDK